MIFPDGFEQTLKDQAEASRNGTFYSDSSVKLIDLTLLDGNGEVSPFMQGWTINSIQDKQTISVNFETSSPQEVSQDHDSDTMLMLFQLDSI